MGPHTHIDAELGQSSGQLVIAGHSSSHKTHIQKQDDPDQGFVARLLSRVGLAISGCRDEKFDKPFNIALVYAPKCLRRDIFMALRSTSKLLIAAFVETVLIWQEKPEQKEHKQTLIRLNIVYC